MFEDGTTHREFALTVEASYGFQKHGMERLECRLKADRNDARWEINPSSVEVPAYESW